VPAVPRASCSPCGTSSRRWSRCVASATRLAATIPDRVIFDKLIQVLGFGCGYRRIADASCSATTLGRRRNEWIALGLAEQLHQLALAAYDRLHGLEPEHLA
jgi:hypothetical protein